MAQVNMSPRLSLDFETDASKSEESLEDIFTET